MTTQDGVDSGLTYHPITPLRASRFKFGPSISPKGDAWPKRLDQTALPAGPKSTWLEHKNRSANQVVYDHPSNTLCPSGWTRLVHPDGKVYYCTNAEEYRYPAIVTQHDITILDNQKVVVSAYDELMRRLRDLGWTAHPEAREEEVYIRIVDGAEGAKCGYYFVAHRPHEVFWVHPVPLKELAAGFDEDANYDLILTQNYFAHLERFPCFANNSIRASDLAFQYNLRDFLVSAVSKELTVSQSTSADLVQIKSPWVDADPKTYLDLFDQLERMNNRSYQVWFVAMLLRLLFHQRNAHCCGMPNATPLWGAARI